MKRVLTVEGDTGDVAPYEEALRQAGIELVFVPASAAAAELLNSVSGLMLMGGTDVNSARYGEIPQPQTESPDDPRDQCELALIEKALERDLAILAICRGMQILNVQHGGSLIQHLEPSGRHTFHGEDKSQSAHSIEIVPNTKLARIAGKLSGEVNSRHHQAISRAGEGLVVSATDPRDGTIEAVERPDKRFVVGVQWHPENQTAERDSIARKLFEAFAAALV
jgi:putative glutamine amidotransferase